MNKSATTPFSLKQFFSKQSGNGRNFVAIWILLVVSCAAVLLFQLKNQQQQYNAGLLGALEINASAHQAAIALGKNYQNKLLLLVGHKSLSKAISKASDISSTLHAKPWLASAYSNPLNSSHLKQLVDYYSGSPFSYLSKQNKTALQQSLVNRDGQALNKDYFELLNQWSDPVVSSTLPHDVTLSLASFLKERFFEQSSGNSQWQFKQQTLMIQGERLSYVPIFVSVKDEYLNVRDSVGIYKTLKNIQLSLTSDESALLMTGLMLHTASSSMQAQHEISTFGVISLIGVMIIVLLAFRSIGPLMACLAVIATSLLLGLVALNFFFDAIHLLAFVFAVSILGISVDYGFHILVLRQYGNTSVQATRKKVFLPLTIALISTIAGYSLFFTTPLSLLHQVVVFVGFGLLGAYLSALLLLPSITIKQKGYLFSFAPKQHIGYAIVAGIIMLSLFSKVNFNDSVSALNTQQASLADEEKKVALLTGESVYPYMVLLGANSRSTLLDESLLVTTALREQGATLKSIADWQLSNEKQLANIALIKDNYDAGNFKQIESYAEEGVILKQIEQAKTLSQLPHFIANNIGLSIEKISKNASEKVNEKTHDKYWTALLLRDPLTPEQADIVKTNSYAQYINLPVALSKQLGQVRQHVVEIALPAMLIILLILSLYYGFSSGVLMMLVPTLSAGLSLVFAQFIQGSLNIFNVLACLLILTLCVDYVVFFRAHGVNKLISHTISLSALSSALTFGVMAFSSTPAVSSFGLTLLIGILFAWLLSHLTPLTLNRTNK